MREIPVTIDVSPVPLEEILPLRELYRQEMNCQIVHDSLPGRGFGNLFLVARGWPGRGLRLRHGVSRRAEGHDQGVLRPARLSWFGAPDIPPAHRDQSGPADRSPDQRRPPHPHALRLRNRDHERHGRLPRRPDHEPRRPGATFPRSHRGGQDADLRARGGTRRRMADREPTAPSPRPAGSSSTTISRTATFSWRWQSPTVGGDTAASWSRS